MALGSEPDSPALLLRGGTVFDGSGAPRYDGITDILITWSTPHPEMAARSLAGIAAEWGCSQKEACERCSPAAPAISRCARTMSSASSATRRR